MPGHSRSPSRSPRRRWWSRQRFGRRKSTMIGSAKSAGRVGISLATPPSTLRTPEDQFTLADVSASNASGNVAPVLRRHFDHAGQEPASERYGSPRRGHIAGSRAGRSALRCSEYERATWAEGRRGWLVSGFTLWVIGRQLMSLVSGLMLRTHRVDCHLG